MKYHHFVLAFALFIFSSLFFVQHTSAIVCNPDNPSDMSRICNRTLICADNSVHTGGDGCMTPAGCSGSAPESCSVPSSSTQNQTPVPVTTTPVVSSPVTSSSPTSSANLSCYTAYPDILIAFGVEQCTQNDVVGQYQCTQRNNADLEAVSNWRNNCNTGKGNWTPVSTTNGTSGSSCVAPSTSSDLSCYTDYSSASKYFGVENCGYYGSSPTLVDVSNQYACSLRNGPRLSALSNWQGGCSGGRGNWGTTAGTVGSGYPASSAQICLPPSQPNPTSSSSTKNPSSTGGYTGTNTTGGSLSVQNQIATIQQQIQTFTQNLLDKYGTNTLVTNTSVTGNTASSSVTPSTNSSGCLLITSDLRQGDAGAQVAVLAGVLMKENLIASASQNVFDQNIFNAVVKYQERYFASILVPNGLTSGTGFVGVSTRGHMNSHMTCAVGSNFNIPSSPQTPATPNPVSGSASSLSCYADYASAMNYFGVELCTASTVASQYSCALRNSSKLDTLQAWRDGCNSGKGNWTPFK